MRIGGQTRNNRINPETRKFGKGKTKRVGYFRSLKTADILALFAIVITLVYGWKGCQLSEQQLTLSRKQDSTSLDIQHFNELLSKTENILRKDSELTVLSTQQLDSLVSLNKTLSKVVENSTSQLVLTQEEDEAGKKINSNIEVGNINRLRNDLIEINDIAFNTGLINGIIDLNHPPHDQAGMSGLTSHLNKLKSLLQNEANNTYLNSSDTLTQLWLRAYNAVVNMERQNNYRLIFEEFDTVGISRMYKSEAKDYFISIGGLTGYGLEKIKKDLIKKGMYNRNGDVKLDPKTLWK